MVWIKDSDTAGSLDVEGIINQAIVSISSTPSGASVVVNGTYLGTTPLSRTLDFGTYVVALSLNGYEGFEQTVTIVSGDPITVALTLVEIPPEKAILNVSSTPVGAEVYINGNYEGTTYVSLTLDAGTYELMMKMPDFPDHIVSVTLVEGQTKDVSKVFVMEAGFNWVVGLGLLGTAYQMLKGK